MAEFEIDAELRENLGKGTSRRMRGVGVVPAVLYGAGKEPVALQLEGRALAKQMEHEAFFAQVLSIRVGKRKQDVVLKDMQRDPVTGDVTHVDFMRVRSEHEIHMNIPLHFVDEETCPGHRAGGVVSRVMVDVEVVCLPRDLPEYIEVSLGELEIGDAVQLSDLVMPAGVQLAALMHDPPVDGPVVSVQHAQKAEEEEEAEGEEPGLVTEESAEVPTTSEDQGEED